MKKIILLLFITIPIVYIISQIPIVSYMGRGINGIFFPLLNDYSFKALFFWTFIVTIFIGMKLKISLKYILWFGLGLSLLAIGFMMSDLIILRGNQTKNFIEKVLDAYLGDKSTIILYTTLLYFLGSIVFIVTGIKYVLISNKQKILDYKFK